MSRRVPPSDGFAVHSQPSTSSLAAAHLLLVRRETSLPAQPLGHLLIRVLAWVPAEFLYGLSIRQAQKPAN
jgi:hypothetical protein